ncbi:FadR family transcriptional regulator [Arthrobacter cheniae]|uniref:FadR family transcriptional regulator n=1 Tax=Arthrobacter cheniae TaxID=1258888 RepID=A0A3A5MCX6_9MICC|nr:FCD domain-containing protein [Arthrobacter cheniae]RJT83439.1 FadR family transcriptional regulator [Arthrobacter cheniae]
MRNHQVVSVWLEQELAAGRLAIGSRLPGERTMAEHLNISRASVREGTRVLEALGVVRAGVGSGPQAGTIITGNPALALDAALRLHVASAHLPIKDIVETRLLLETWCVEHASRDSPALERAAALLDEMDRHHDGPAGFLERDALFHVALAEAAGNVLIGAMMGSLRGSIADYTQRLTAGLPVWTTTSERLRREHRAILAAVVGGQGAHAAHLVRDHIEGFYRESGIHRHSDSA